MPNRAVRTYTTLFISAAQDVMTHPEFPGNLQAALRGAKRPGVPLPIFFNAAAGVTGGVAVKKHDTGMHNQILEVTPPDIAEMHGDVLAISLADDAEFNFGDQGFWLEVHEQIDRLRPLHAANATFVIGAGNEAEEAPSVTIMGVVPVERISGVRLTHGQPDIVLRP